MQELIVAWNAIKYGGAMVYPLLVLGVLAIAIIIDRAVLYARCLRLPSELADLVETYGFRGRISKSGSSDSGRATRTDAFCK